MVVIPWAVSVVGFPIPDNWRICGVWTAPAANTTLFEVTIVRGPSDVSANYTVVLVNTTRN